MSQLDEQLKNYNDRSPRRTTSRLRELTAAVSAAVAMAQSADAAIIYSGLQNVTLTRGSNVSNDLLTFLNLDGTGNLDMIMIFGYTAGRASAHAQMLFAGALQDTGSFQRVINVPYGSSIPVGGPGVLSISFGQFILINALPPFGFFPNNSTGFAGVRFNHAGSPVFGWLQISITNIDQVGGTVRVIDWAYEDTGAAIRAGDVGVVPEPSSLALGSLGLLALGAAGVKNYRKRRQEAASAKQST